MYVHVIQPLRPPHLNNPEKPSSPSNTSRTTSFQSGASPSPATASSPASTTASFSIKPTPPLLPNAPFAEPPAAPPEGDPSTPARDGLRSHGRRAVMADADADAAAVATGAVGLRTVLMRVRIVSAGWETMAPATPAVIPATMETWCVVRKLGWVGGCWVGVAWTGSTSENWVRG